MKEINMKELLVKWNVWWEYKKVPENKVLIIRGEILKDILKLIKTKEILVLTGVRRSGKSTFIYQTINDLINNNTNAKNILYFNFDEPLQDKSTEVLEQVFTTFLEINNPKGRKYVFFDEIQVINEWERWIKKYYDMYGNEIKFIITGSNSSMLSSNLLKLLTGRILTKQIFPLFFKEFLNFNQVKIDSMILQKEEIKHYLLDYLNKGGFPEVVLENNDDINNKRLKEYFDGILFRDIVKSKNVREMGKLTELAYYTITNISTEFSYNKISKNIGININSLREYLNYLEEAYLIFQLKYFSYSLKESIMIQKPRKIYCIDNGLRNAVSFKFSKDEGKLVENLVFIELRRKELDVYYWKDKYEVDFVIKNKDQSLTAINVSYTNKIDEREINSLLDFKNKFNKTKELIVITKDLEKEEQGIQFIPLWKWLLE
ncbi:MAG: ATP-binding protein [archaeon]